MMENRPLRIFLCHSSKDNSVARELSHQLDAEGWMDVWFIESRLLPSQNWGPEIMKGVESADVLIVLLSKNFYTEEQTHYPNWNFVSNRLEASQNKEVLIIPLVLDDSNVPTDLKTWQAINYFPKKQRKSSYQKLLAGLETYARQLDISLDKHSPPPVPEKGMQWTPSLWKQLDAEIEDKVESKPPNLRLSRVRQRFRKRLFSGVNNLFVWAAAIGTLLLVSICGLMINTLVRGENTNSITAPIVSRALPLIPLPTPTLGVGSVRISPVDGMRMVYVPAGEFLMGSEDHQDDEKPVHKVYLDAYWIDQYEVTNGMYAKCVKTKICWPENSEFFDQLATDPEFFNQPVMNIHWGNANAYCRWVDRRLPTEAEWEKAARGVDGRTYPWGETVDCTKANFFSCVDNPSRVGSFEAGQSPYGVYDMAGNAMEWVADWYGSTYYQISSYENPLGPISGRYRVFRGGSWQSEVTAGRATNRPGYIANVPSNYIGFRCALSE